MERIFLVLGLTFLLLGAVAPQHEGWELILFLGLGLTLWGAYRRGLRGLIMVVVLTLYLYVYWFAHGAMDGIVLLKSFSRHLTDDEANYVRLLVLGFGILTSIQACLILEMWFKKKRFAKVFGVCMAVSALIGWFLFVIAKGVHQNASDGIVQGFFAPKVANFEPWGDYMTWAELAYQAPIVGLLVFLPYLLISRRCRRTFGESTSEEKLHIGICDQPYQSQASGSREAQRRPHGAKASSLSLRETLQDTKTGGAHQPFRCRQCEAPRPQGAGFCGVCGEPATQEDVRTERKCSFCEAPLLGNDFFCGQCGKKVAAPERASSSWMSSGMPSQPPPSGRLSGGNPERAEGEGSRRPHWLETSPPDLAGRPEKAQADRPRDRLPSPEASRDEELRRSAPGWKTFVLLFVGIPLAACLVLQATMGLKEKAQGGSGIPVRPAQASQAPTTLPADAQKDEWVATVPRVTVSSAVGLWVVSRDRPRDEPPFGKEVEVLADEGGIAYIGDPLKQPVLLTPGTLNQLFPDSFLLIEGIDAATFGAHVQRDPNDRTVRVVRAICAASVPVAAFLEVGMLPVEQEAYEPACVYIGNIPQPARPGNSEMAWSAVPHSESPLRTVTGVVVEASYGNRGGGFSIKSASGDVAEFSVYSSPEEPPTDWKALPRPSDVGEPFEVTYRDIKYTGAIKSSCDKRILSVRALNADVPANVGSNTITVHATPSASVFMGRSLQITTPPVDGDGSAVEPATICLTSPQGQQCFKPPAGSNLPSFGLRPEARAVRLRPGYEGLLFTAKSSGGGSGSLHLLALLEPGAGSNLENLLPPGLSVTEQGEYRFWGEPSVSDTALLVLADYVFGDGETHFSAHSFRIDSYVFSSEVRHYQLRDEYVTSKKYPSLDEVDSITVLEQEKPEVLRRLQGGRPR